MVERIFELEHHPEEGWVLRFRPRGLRLVPEETHTHIHEARKEMLLGLRSIIDRAIERDEEAGKSGGKGPTKIDIQ